MEEEYGEMSDFVAVEIANGICWLAAVAREDGFKVEIIDAEALRISNDEVIEILKQKKPKIVGIYACTPQIYDAHDICEEVKRFAPNTITLIGGPHLTAVPKETMDRLPDFDIGVVGEGEATCKELFTALLTDHGKNLSEIKGLILRKNGHVVTTGPRDTISDLDSIPLPAWDLLPDLKKYYMAPAYTRSSGATATIITSRGCPAKCTFCDRSVFGNSTRFHSADYVIKMIETLYNDHGIRHIRFSDDNFLLNRPRLKKVCNYLIEERPDVTWSCLSRVDTIREPIMPLIQKAGCVAIALGIESGNQEILDLEMKRCTLEQMETAVALCRKHKISVISLNMLGHPKETLETIKETVDFNKKLKVDEFKLEFLTPYPGTELYRTAHLYGEFDDDWRKFHSIKEPLFIPHGLTKEELMKASQMAYFSFYTQPRIIYAYLKKLRNWAIIRAMFTAVYLLLKWKLLAIIQPLDKKRVIPLKSGELNE